MSTKLKRSKPSILKEFGGPEQLVPMHARMPGHLARRFHRIHTVLMNEALAAENLTAATYGALVTINRSPGLTQRTMADERGLDYASAGQIVDELEDQKLVRRLADPDDRRAWRLELTEKGKRVRDRAGPAALAAQQRMLSVLSKQEIETLRELMARVIDANAAHDRPGADRRRKTKSSKS